MAGIAGSRGLMGSVRRWLGGRRAGVPQIAARTVETASAAAPADRRIEVMLAEWQDIRASLRHSDSMRLAELATFLAASAAIIAGYLSVASAPDPRLNLARWALASLGLLASLVFLGLQLGAISHRDALARRGRQIETAMQILLPGIGRVKSLALLSEFQPAEGEWALAGAWVAGALSIVMLLAWATALVAMALGLR